LATTNPSLTPDQVRTLIEAGSAAVYDATHDDFSAGTTTVPKVMDLTGVVYNSSVVNYAHVYLYGTDGVDLKHDALSSKTIAPRSENKLVYDFGSMTLTTVAAPGMTESSFVALSDNYYMVGDRGNGALKYIYRINETTPYQTITESLFWNLAMTDLYFICASASAYKMYYRDTSDIWTEFHSKTTGVVCEYDSDIYDKTAVIQTSTGLDIITIVPGATQDDAPTVTTETITTNNCTSCRIYENTIVYVDNLTKTMHVWERLDSTSQWVEIKTFINTNIGGVSLYKDTLTRKANSPLAAALHVYDRVNGTWNDTPSSTLTLPGTTYGHTTSIHEEFIIVGNNGAGDAALYKRVNGVWGTTHTAVDYGSFEPWDVKIRNNIILIGRAASFYKYEGTTTVVPPELGPFVTITDVSDVTSGVLTITGTVFSGFANVTGGVRAAVFDTEMDLSDTANVASFVNTNGTDLSLTTDVYIVGGFVNNVNEYFSTLLNTNTSALSNGGKYNIVVIANDGTHTGIEKFVHDDIDLHYFSINVYDERYGDWTQSPLSIINESDNTTLFDANTLYTSPLRRLYPTLGRYTVDTFNASTSSFTLCAWVTFLSDKMFSSNATFSMQAYDGGEFGFIGGLRFNSNRIGFQKSGHGGADFYAGFGYTVGQRMFIAIVKEQATNNLTWTYKYLPSNTTPTQPQSYSLQYTTGSIPLYFNGTSSNGVEKVWYFKNKALTSDDVFKLFNDSKY
jgi:hypothetical protein